MTYDPSRRAIGGTRAVDPHPVGPRAVGPHAVGPRAVAPRAVDPHAVGPQVGACQCDLEASPADFDSLQWLTLSLGAIPPK